MKDLLEYKIESLIEQPSECWKDIFSKVLNKFVEFGVSDRAEKFSQRYLKFNKFNNFNRFEADFITALIYYALDLQTSQLWNNIFEITKEDLGEDHYGNGHSIMWEFRLKSKEDQLKDINGTWVYVNYDKVDEFLKLDNKTYKQLQELSKLFPIVEVV